MRYGPDGAAEAGAAGRARGAAGHAGGAGAGAAGLARRQRRRGPGDHIGAPRPDGSLQRHVRLPTTPSLSIRVRAQLSYGERLRCRFVGGNLLERFGDVEVRQADYRPPWLHPCRVEWSRKASSCPSPPMPAGAQGNRSGGGRHGHLPRFAPSLCRCVPADDENCTPMRHATSGMRKQYSTSNKATPKRSLLDKVRAKRARRRAQLAACAAPIVKGAQWRSSATSAYGTADTVYSGPHRHDSDYHKTGGLMLLCSY